MCVISDLGEQLLTTINESLSEDKSEAETALLLYASGLSDSNVTNQQQR